MPSRPRPTLVEIRQAQATIAGVARETPLLSSRTFSEISEATVFLKAENLQRTGSFKVRGASNRIAQLTPQERRRGIIAASAGNHSQGVALAAWEAGVACTVVMPEGASISKLQATRGYGAEVALVGADYDEALAEATRRASADGLTFIPGYDDPAVMAGQGTVGLEILAQLPDTDAVLVPVGGGGLLGGIAIAIKESNPKIKVYGVQVAAAPAAAMAFQDGRRLKVHPKPTIADAIAVGRLGQHPYAAIRRYVDDIVLVSEEEIAHAVVLLLERGKMLVEGAGAAGTAALLGGKIRAKGRNLVAILSGGNVDLPLFTRILDHGLAKAGRFLAVRVLLRDRPGELAQVLDVLTKCEANVTEVSHHRRGLPLSVGLIEVELLVETRDGAHIDHIANILATNGYLPQRRPSAPGLRPELYVVSRDATTAQS